MQDTFDKIILLLASKLAVIKIRIAKTAAIFVIWNTCEDSNHFYHNYNKQSD